MKEEIMQYFKDTERGKCMLSMLSSLDSIMKNGSDEQVSRIAGMLEKLNDDVLNRVKFEDFVDCSEDEFQEFIAYKERNARYALKKGKK